MEQVFFNVPLSKLEPVLKSWMKDVFIEYQKSNLHPIEEPERLLTIQEASEFLHLTVPTIYSKVSRGELPVMKKGKRLYFSNVELLDYLKSGKRKSNSELEGEANAHINKLKKGRL